MRVLVLAQHYPPESGGAQNRLHSLVVGLVDHGHDVTVITAVPNHPDGVVRPGYRRKAWVVENRDRARVVHVWIHTSPRGGSLARLLSYGSYVGASFLASLAVKRPVHIVFASSPPLTVGLAAWLVALTKRAPFVFDVRDLWPDVAVALGELRGSGVIRVARFLERFIYRHASAITAVTEGFVEAISGRAGQGARVILIRNGSSLIGTSSGDRASELRRTIPRQGGLLVGYVGQFGLAQGLDHVLEAASTLQEGADSSHFVLVGSGPRESAIRHRLEALGLRNVTIVGRVPQEEAVAWMEACDVLLAPLAPNPVYATFVPSKIYDALALGRPVLYSVPGESRAIVEQAGSGWYYDPGNPSSLVDQIRWLGNHRDEIRVAGEAGRRYATAHLDRSVQSRLLERLLVGIAKPPQKGVR